MSRSITVIGGGIIGASIAWHLTTAGAKVRLVCETTGGVATPNSFAWINASWGNPHDYFKLRMRAIAEWSRLKGEVPDLPLSFRGGICWDMPEDDLIAYAENHAAWGYDINRIDAAAISAREPALAAVPALALDVPVEGVAEPQETAEMLIADAKRRGMELVENVHVTGLRKDEAGRIISIATDHGEWPAEEVVLAAGAATAELAATIGVDVPLETPPGLLVHSKPAAPLINGLVIAPELHLRQTAEGRLVAGTDFGGMDPGTDPDGAAEELFAKVKAFVRDGESLEMDFYTIGYRPTPEDGFPIVGRADGVEGLYLAVTHSGITLAPALGLFAAREILDGEREPLLAPYRLSRFE
ncbi:FAD-binding oxidoreductase [Aliirhizobium terrae]|uniref:NAD(P)/FAD-dependent oxidoreductase n=1 Tax=Terrirhizobium terrae TaxID=2926709 RepID=UPI002578D840|nr:FAD-binding oxidoreductase [Rhizobium sp. CC-CFT758]WJH40842.1 FAD-binding oxidoreductase [Rhizobium sp. CC-CFT758]